MNENDEQEIDLSALDHDYAEAPVEDRSQEVPDGRYQVLVERVYLTKARSTGNPLLRWTLRILGPTHSGRLLFRNNVMLSKENLRWLKSDLHTCGLELGRLSDLANQLESLLDVRLEVVKRTRGDNVSVYFNRQLRADEAAGREQEPRDDIAF